MKFAVTGAAALLLGTTQLMAGGIERAPQSLNVLFEPGNYAELSFGHVSPTVTGRDVPTGAPVANVAKSYGFVGVSYKHQFTPEWSAAFIVDQPFGADLSYPGNPAASMLGGTNVTVTDTHFTGVLRYKVTDAFGVHGGIRGGRASADVTLSGLAYGPLNGYRVTLDQDTRFGWLAGVSWERPDIAARVALTYNSPITRKFGTTEYLTASMIGVHAMMGNSFDAVTTGTTKVRTPRSINLDFQTGVAEDTLVFGSVRWVKWSEFLVEPRGYSTFPDQDQNTGAVVGTLGSLTDLQDSTTYTLGVGRKFTDNWSGAVSYSWEKRGNDLVSPLAPTNGKKGITLAAIYNQDNFTVTTGINYTKLGNARPETGTPDTARAEMTGNDLWGIGIRVGYRF
ncbi:OmpP1/FadL family transporter [Paracoccus sp. (in: a-proteobacteria)]|uniref:OmpP1/FadL family transporter n=1 Tax=Paracoccus sp. TaxID=267 RepID=UPI0026E09393|nr:outer membrane protein transport protein [Paracoccus sp. (in: a-proteobacteria)]MDO5646647.1 outer membrane protein transport protein [Paracoccus sp. (in: a-proteobacteria)]